MESRRNKRAPVRVALTGGIGAGKSAALSMLAARGVPCLDADNLVHGLLREDEIQKQVAARLGVGSLEAGESGRRQLAGAVFADDEKLRALEQIVFPLVRARIVDWFGQPPAAGAPLAAVEVPLLFESGMENLFDGIVLITAPAGLRRDRSAIRGGADFERRSSRQLPEAEKRRRADIVFENTGSLRQLEEFIDGLVEWLQAGGKQ